MWIGCSYFSKNTISKMCTMRVNSEITQNGSNEGNKKQDRASVSFQLSKYVFTGTTCVGVCVCSCMLLPLEVLFKDV